MKTDKLQHHPKTLEIMRSLKKMDGFPFDGEAIKKSLDQARGIGQIGIFLLDCIVAEPKATSSSVGKVPIVDPEQIIANSAILYQTEPLEYLLQECTMAGLKVALWCFLGDDDFQYSVSPEYQISDSSVHQAVTNQIGIVDDQVRLKFERDRVSIHVQSWLETEQKHSDLVHQRELISQQIKRGFEGSSLPPKITKRLGDFVNWRLNAAAMNGVAREVIGSLAKEQACEELASFAFQGLAAPGVIRSDGLGMPIIFANSFPNMGKHQLDDECVRFGETLGFSGQRYGTIHLPGPERLAKQLGRAQKSLPGKMLTCGDPGSFNPKK